MYDAYNQQNGVSSIISNLLAVLLKQFAKTNKDALRAVKVILLKDPLIHNFHGKFDMKLSQVVVLDLSSAEIDEDSFVGCDPSQISPPIDLKSSLDEASLASEAVDLNIKLMKWRVLPSLDLDMLKSTKV